jgi:hypothetical protein
VGSRISAFRVETVFAFNPCPLNIHGIILLRAGFLESLVQFSDRSTARKHLQMPYTNRQESLHRTQCLGERSLREVPHQ